MADGIQQLTGCLAGACLRGLQPGGAERTRLHLDLVQGWTGVPYLVPYRSGADACIWPRGVENARTGLTQLST